MNVTMKSTRFPHLRFELRVSACPKIIRENLALVKATFILLSSDKKLNIKVK